MIPIPRTFDDLYRIFDAIIPDEYGCHQYPRAHLGYHKQEYIDRTRQYVHRLALERKLGRSIQSGYLTCHHCDCASCVNPDHLYEGTHKDNHTDALARAPGYREQLKQNYARARAVWNNSPENWEHLKRISKMGAVKGGKACREKYGQPERNSKGQWTKRIEPDNPEPSA